MHPSRLRRPADPSRWADQSNMTALGITNNASGNPYIRVRKSSFELFEPHAAEIAKKLGGKIGRSISDGSQIQCPLIIDNKEFWIAFDVWDDAICIEPKSTFSHDEAVKMAGLL